MDNVFLIGTNADIISRYKALTKHMKNNFSWVYFQDSWGTYKFVNFTDQDFNDRIKLFAKNNPNEWAVIWDKVIEDDEYHFLEEWLSHYEDYPRDSHLDSKYRFILDYIVAKPEDRYYGADEDRLNDILGLIKF